MRGFDNLDWFRIVSVIISGGAWVGALVAWRNAKATSAALESARKKEHDVTAFVQFVAMCSSRQGRAEQYDVIHRQAGQLYAHLAANDTDVFRAKYIATTGCAWFYKGNTPDMIERQQFEHAREGVEQHLRDPNRMWNVPSSGVVHDWAHAIGPRLGNPPWLLTRSDEAHCNS